MAQRAVAKVVEVAGSHAIYISTPKDVAALIREIATLANVAFKTGLAFALGSAALLARLILPVAFILVGGVSLVLAWPSPA